MKIIASITTSLCASLALCATVMAQDAKPKPSVLITSANIFDGKSDKLATGMSVLVEGNKITKIAKSITAPAAATVIDAAGRTLMPGMIDMHYHVALASTEMADGVGTMAPDLDFMGISAALEAERLLKRGFTSIRDVGGASWGAKIAADRDMIAGPRIWPSLRALSQIGGHDRHQAVLHRIAHADRWIRPPFGLAPRPSPRTATSKAG